MNAQILIYYIECGVSACFLLNKSLKMQLLDEVKITLKEN